MYLLSIYVTTSFIYWSDWPAVSLQFTCTDLFIFVHLSYLASYTNTNLYIVFISLVISLRYLHIFSSPMGFSNKVIISITCFSIPLGIHIVSICPLSSFIHARYLDDKDPSKSRSPSHRYCMSCLIRPCSISPTSYNAWQNNCQVILLSCESGLTFTYHSAPKRHADSANIICFWLVETLTLSYPIHTTG